jgi:nanoRNase/pAp phosphatase (c-di-AMP/oligoRNAs hydrolase)
MRHDVFNGDADGLCALQQLRLAAPASARLVTGTKRDVGLLARVDARANDEITVLDVSVAANRAALDACLALGAHVRWFDHHHAGELPAHARFVPHLDPDPGVCTSLIVDRHLAGRHRSWAIVAAFGDNLHREAERLAREQGHSDAEIATLQSLGEALNYNAYGDSVADLRFPPGELAMRIRPYADPLAFAHDEDVLPTLLRGYRQDLALAHAIGPTRSTGGTAIFVLPAEAWARRAIGAFANRLAAAAPARAHAVLAERRDGSYVVSVRAPIALPDGADELCALFATGGGRKGAGGIDRLPAGDLDRFLAAFSARYERD